MGAIPEDSAFLDGDFQEVSMAVGTEASDGQGLRFPKAEMRQLVEAVYVSPFDKLGKAVLGLIPKDVIELIEINVVQNGDNVGITLGQCCVDVGGRVQDDIINQCIRLFEAEGFEPSYSSRDMSIALNIPVGFGQ